MPKNRRGAATTPVDRWQRSRIVHAGLLALNLSAAFFYLLPWNLASVDLGLDPSWRWAVINAWNKGLVFGREIVFTFGPYGFLFADTYHPDTFLPALAFLAALAALLALSIWRALMAASGSPVIAGFGLFLYIFTMNAWDVSQTLSFHLCFALWAVYWLSDSPARNFPGHRGAGHKEDRARSFLIHALAGALALASLVKFTSLTMAAAPMVSIAVNETWRKRRFPWLIVTAAASGLLLWILAAQPVGALPSYFRNSLEIALGYNETMGLDGPAREMLLYLAAAGLFLALCVQALWNKLRWRAVLPAGALAVMLFLLFKVSFVRHDGHAVTPASTLLPWSIFLLFFLWVAPHSKWLRYALLLCVATSAAYANLVLVHYERNSLPKSVWKISSTIANRIAVETGFVHGQDYAARHATALEAIRSLEPLPPLGGTVDVYPTLLSVALAHELQYAPRPVFQSYSAYTPLLSRMNADHLNGPAAPDHLLFAMGTVDNRYSAMDDGLSWPIIMSRYAVAGATGVHLLLRKVPVARRLSYEQVANRPVGFDEWVRLPKIPEAGLLWIKLRFQPRWAGRIAAFAYKAPAVTIAVRLEDGEVLVRRILPKLAGEGFLLSPLVESIEDFAVLMQSPQYDSERLRAVESILIVRPGGVGINRPYRDSIGMELLSLTVR